MSPDTQKPNPRLMNPFREPYVDPNAEKLAALTSEDLQTPVRHALNSETAQVLMWTHELIKGRGGDAQEGLGVYRFSGTARDQGQDEIPWSIMLKTTQPAQDKASYAGKREIQAYQSGFLEDLPGRIAVPQFFGVTEYPAGDLWIWLESLVDEIGETWPLERFGLAARHLGQLNGAYLAGRPLPDFDWLSRGWLRQYTDQYTDSMARLEAYVQHPLMQKFYPQAVVTELQWLWSQREAWLNVIARLPQTFCHMDAFRRNLFARRTSAGQEVTMAIDWSYTGIGAVGEDLTPLVAMGQARPDGPVSDWRALDTLAFEQYGLGLQDAGWRGDLDLARLGFVISAPLRYGFMGTRFMEFFSTLDEEKQTQLLHWIDARTDKSKNFLARLQEFLFELADEAKHMLDKRG